MSARQADARVARRPRPLDSGSRGRRADGEARADHQRHETTIAGARRPTRPARSRRGPRSVAPRAGALGSSVGSPWRGQLPRRSPRDPDLRAVRGREVPPWRRRRDAARGRDPGEKASHAPPRTTRAHDPRAGSLGHRWPCGPARRPAAHPGSRPCSPPSRARLRQPEPLHLAAGAAGRVGCAGPAHCSAGRALVVGALRRPPQTSVLGARSEACTMSRSGAAVVSAGAAAVVAALLRRALGTAGRAAGLARRCCPLIPERAGAGQRLDQLRATPVVSSVSGQAPDRAALRLRPGWGCVPRSLPGCCCSASPAGAGDASSARTAA
jgi:hypothetical protein